MNHENLSTSSPGTGGKIVSALAGLPGKALLDERAVAALFVVSMRTVRRMVVRNELPPPVPLAGKSTWVAERIIAHIDARAERAARHAEREALRIKALSLR